MTILSDRDIRKEIQAGNIVLFHPNRDASENIQNCSVDFTLGRNYFRHTSTMDVLNPWSEKQSRKYWGNPLIADTIKSKFDEETYDLPFGTEYIYMRPYETILGHTQEFIGGKNNITTIMKARSSLGRSNVTVCRDAGFGDIGYINRWTLEITNNNPIPIVLPVGARIGQIAFYYTGQPDTTYHGKYQIGETLEEIVKLWDPTMMTPALWKDKNLNINTEL